MRSTSTVTAVAGAIATLVCCAATGSGAERSAFFLSVSPGNYVEYLSLSNSGHAVTGYLESIRASASSPAGETRSQSFVSVPSSGNVIVFGTRRAKRAGDGYTLTTATSTGATAEQRFAPASVARVNDAIASLGTVASRHETLQNLSVAKAELTQDTDGTSSQAPRLVTAQQNIEATGIAQVESQRKADALASAARRLRLDANAAITTPGATLALNRKSIDAMKVADDAALSARSAQSDADAAGQNASLAVADLKKLRASIAALTERARQLFAKLKENTGTIAHR